MILTFLLIAVLIGILLREALYWLKFSFYEKSVFYTLTSSPKSIIHFILGELNDFGIIKEAQGDEVTALPFNIKIYDLKIPVSLIVSTVCQCFNYSFENDETAHLRFPGYTFSGWDQ